MSDAPNSWVLDVTEAEFEQKVLARSHDVPVVVDFWAEWCGPCRVLGPILEKLAAELEGKFILAKVNVDEAPQLGQVFQLRSIPAVIAFRGGEAVLEFTGAIPEQGVRDFLNKVCPSEADSLVERAVSVQKDDSERAKMLYEQALALEPQHEGARVGLSEIALAAGDHEGARNGIEGLIAAGPLGERIEQVRASLILENEKPEASEEELRQRVADNPKDGEAWMDLGRLFVAERRYPEALEALMKAAESSRKLAKGKAKTLMVEIFHVVGVRSELSDEYRTKLSRLLY